MSENLEENVKKTPLQSIQLPTLLSKYSMHRLLQNTISTAKKPFMPKWTHWRITERSLGFHFDLRLLLHKVELLRDKIASSKERALVEQALSTVLVLMKYRKKQQRPIEKTSTSVISMTCGFRSSVWPRSGSMMLSTQWQPVQRRCRLYLRNRFQAQSRHQSVNSG